MSDAIGGTSGSGLGRALGILALVVLALLLLAGLIRGAAIVAPQRVAQTTATPAPQCPSQTDSGTPVFIVRLSMSKYPQATNHILVAKAKGKPLILTLDRPGAKKRRQQALAGWPTKPNLERDEYPPSLALEGGAGADIEYIDPSDNAGAGATMGNAVNGPPRQPDGTKFCLEVVP